MTFEFPSQDLCCVEWVDHVLNLKVRSNVLLPKSAFSVCHRGWQIYCSTLCVCVFAHACMHGCLLVGQEGVALEKRVLFLQYTEYLRKNGLRILNVSYFVHSKTFDRCCISKSLVHHSSFPNVVYSPTSLRHCINTHIMYKLLVNSISNKFLEQKLICL